MNKWMIDKQFSFCYGHRVWVQKLEQEFCAKGDTKTKCRHLHGHEGLVHVFLESSELNKQGMVTDFKHLGWLKDFLDNNVDHKFILDLNDPYFSSIINAEPIFDVEGQKPLLGLAQKSKLNYQAVLISAIPVLIPGTNHLTGYALDTKDMEGPEKEFYEGFFLVNFVPTSENLCKWLFECAQAKMSLINVQVSRIDWFETPKSRSSYFA
ncbi:MAG: 6-carboxytetrahydropterin synthase [Candidatus Thermoplasmatota archaeon]